MMELNEFPGARFIEYEANHGCFFLGGLLGGGGAALGGLFGFLGSSQAASQQAAAEQAALAFQQQVYGQTQNQLRPFLQGGTHAWEQLLAGMGSPTHPGVLTESPARFGGLPGAPPAYNYQAPTLSTFQSSPGYKFQLGQGVQAIQDAAGGRTGILGGNTMQALQQYGTGLANQDWYNFLNNYNTQYAQKYAADTQNYWNRYGAAANTQSNLFNRFAGTAQAGQQAANTSGQQGTAFAGLIGNQLNQLGATNAAGTLGQYGALASIFGPGGVGSGGGTGGGGFLSNLFGGGSSNQPPLSNLFAGQGGGAGLPGIGNYSAIPSMLGY